jgi:hypothetical protein
MQISLWRYQSSQNNRRTHTSESASCGVVKVIISCNFIESVVKQVYRGLTVRPRGANRVGGIGNDSNIKDNYKKGNKTFFNERSPKSIESTLFHGSGDYFVLAPINTNLAPN